MKHPNVVQLLYCFHDPKHLYFGLDLAPNGELHHFIHRKRLKDSDIEFIAAEILNCLQYFTSVGIVHRDIKPSNILFSEEMHIKIADFGAARYLKLLEKESLNGTPQYLSPEMVSHQLSGPAQDLWALGVVIYIMFT